MQKFLPRFVIGSILIVFSGLVSFIFSLGPVSAAHSTQAFEIKKGDSFDVIAAHLKDGGLIRSTNAFKLFSLFAGSAHRLKPGSYFLNTSSSTPALVNRLVEGPRDEIKITVIEGMSLKDIDRLLSGQGIIAQHALEHVDLTSLRRTYPFLLGAQSLEGFLFPDTYQFFAGSATEDVVQKFLNAFQTKAWPLLKEQHNFNNTLTLASLIEKEVSGSFDRRIVAGILTKRLAEGMALQVDATVSYAKCAGTFTTCNAVGVARKDIDIVSPFNTYAHAGLPPAPISNPGLDAISAALHPIHTEYWYYLSDSRTKKTIFSRTLDEHNDNRAEHL